MIRLTRLNHVPVYLNSDLIEHIEITPDTVISLTSGQKIVVLETAEEVVDRVIAFRRAILEQPAKQAPLDTVKNALIKLTGAYESAPARKQMMEIDRFIRSNETLRAREATKYAQQEQAVFEALCEMWPQPKRRQALRIVAMMSIGAFRLAIDNWSKDEGRRPFAAYLRDCFASIKAET